MAEPTGSYRDILQTELDKALRERGELDAAIAYLRRRLGIEAESGDAASDNGQPEGAPKIGSTQEPAVAINPGRFFGYTAPRASREILEMVGRERPLRTQQIYNAITKGGVKLHDPDALAKALRRNKAFFRVGRGLWGLREWYPASAREWTPESGADDEDDGPGNGQSAADQDSLIQGDHQE